jgi:hypothetical protein
VVCGGGDAIHTRSLRRLSKDLCLQRSDYFILVCCGALGFRSRYSCSYSKNWVERRLNPLTRFGCCGGRLLARTQWTIPPLFQQSVTWATAIFWRWAGKIGKKRSRRFTQNRITSSLSLDMLMGSNGPCLFAFSIAFDVSHPFWRFFSPAHWRQRPAGRASWLKMTWNLRPLFRALYTCLANEPLFFSFFLSILIVVLYNALGGI